MKKIFATFFCSMALALTAHAADQKFNLTSDGEDGSLISGSCTVSPTGLGKQVLRLTGCTNTRGVTATDLHVFSEYRDGGPTGPIIYTGNPLLFDPINVPTGATFDTTGLENNVIFAHEEYFDATERGLTLKVHGFWTPTIPEPETYALVVSGLIVSAVARRRRLKI